MNHWRRFVFLVVLISEVHLDSGNDIWGYEDEVVLQHEEDLRILSIRIRLYNSSSSWIHLGHLRSGEDECSRNSWLDPIQKVVSNPLPQNVHTLSKLTWIWHFISQKQNTAYNTPKQVNITEQTLYTNMITGSLLVEEKEKGIFGKHAGSNSWAEDLAWK